MGTFQYLGHGRVKIKVKGEDGACEHDDERDKGRVLKVGQLNFHRAELDAPTDGAVWWRRLEPHRLPVGRLDVFKVVRRVGVVLVEQLTVDHEGVANKQVRNVTCQQIVHTLGSQLIVDGVIVYQIEVIVLGTVVGTLRQKAVDGVIP